MLKFQQKLVVIGCLILVAFFSFFSLSKKTVLALNSKDVGERLLTVHDNGTSRGILTEKATLKEAFAEAKISIDSNDLVEPKLDDELVAGSYDVNIYRARPVVVVDGMVRKKVMSAYRTPEQIVNHAGINLQAEDIITTSQTTDLLANGGAMQLYIERALKINFVLYGKKAVIYTQAETIADLLKERKINLNPEDTLSPAKDVKISPDMTIAIWRNGIQTVTEDEEITFQVEKIQDMDQMVGYRQVKEAGSFGKRLVTYMVEMKDGVEVGRKEIKSIVTLEPKKQVEIVGVKNNYSGSLNEWLLALRTCETGNNYSRNSGNGYYGAYQFLPSTWNSIASRTGRTDLVGVRPDLANPADQDAMVIANANATAGLSTQHPGCYAKLGLSNKPPAN